jgi:CPA2 family monovalent cation:H+ antiporter-2
VFTSFFFISIGMLLDIGFLLSHPILILAAVVAVLLIKAIVGGATTVVLGYPLRTVVLVGLAVSQVGEFSFILAKIGFSYSILPDYYYQLFLAVAVITIAATPFMIRLSLPLYNFLLKLRLPKTVVNGLFPLEEMTIPGLKNHLVIIGKDASALKLSVMAKYNNISHVSVVFDPSLAREKMKSGDVVVYGDAINEPVLRKAHVDAADIVVISVGSIIPSVNIIEKTRSINSSAYILVRSPLIQNVGQLYKAGADNVLPEKLEIAIDLLNRILLKRDVPQKEINHIISHVRYANLGAFMEKDTVNQPSVLEEFSDTTIVNIPVAPLSDMDGKSPAETELRKKTGVTLLAIKRGNEIIEHPAPDIILMKGDIAYVLGDPAQVKLAAEMFSAS